MIGTEQETGSSPRAIHYLENNSHLLSYCLRVDTALALRMVRCTGSETVGPDRTLQKPDPNLESGSWGARSDRPFGKDDPSGVGGAKVSRDRVGVEVETTAVLARTGPPTTLCALPAESSVGLA